MTSPTHRTKTTRRTPLVGRDHDVAALTALARRDDVPLVTVIGPGGVGKTRVALAVAEQVADTFPHGVWVIDLSALTEAHLVMPTIAQAFGLDLSGTSAILERLITFLHDRTTLLVLDTLEHVTDFAEDLVALLDACQGLTVLGTSRAPLRLSVEQTYALAPLAVPLPDADASTDEILQASAVDLFVQRARAVKPSFTVPPEHVRAVAEICRRLDGLPLAIELAASRVRLLSPPDMLRRMDPSLPLLAHGERDRPARQQTLRNTIAWSDGLLTPDAQRVFCQLGVFVDGWTLDAAEAVCDTDGDILSAMDVLVDHHLVQAVADADGNVRFSMLQTIREYALEQLAEAGALVATQQRHAEFFSNLAERIAPELHRPDQQRWLDYLDTEHNNLRAAIGYAVGDAPATALRLAGTLGWFWYVRGHLTDGCHWLQQALAVGSGHDDHAEASALLALGMLLRARCAYDDAIEVEERALAMFRAQGDDAGIWATLCDLGYVHLFAGRPEQARPLLEEGLELARRCGDRSGMARLLSGLALTNSDVHLNEESLALYRELGDLRNIARLLGFVGYDRLFVTPDLERADAALEEAVALSRQLGATPMLTFHLLLLGHLALERADLATASAYLTEALRLDRDIGQLSQMGTGFERFARLAAMAAAPEQAAQLIGAAASLRERLGDPIQLGERPNYDQTLDMIHAMVTDDAFEQARDTGARMAIDDVIDLALAIAQAVRAATPNATPARLDPPAAATATFGLTPRERDVLYLVAQGLTDADVAERLFLARRTVNTHLTSIYTKLGVNSRAAATRFAIEHGLT
jgi:predicted ATPase/DNA-binding CsgD family transcriptional regulator